jgi:circadian clock protein KaiB
MALYDTGSTTDVPGPPEYVFHLFVGGQTPQANRAIVNVRSACERHFKGRYSLTVVDVRSDTSIAAKQQLIALPTLVKKFPTPEVRCIGDFSDGDKFLDRFKI